MQRVLTVIHIQNGLNEVLDAIKSLGFEPQVIDPLSTGEAVKFNPVHKPWWPLVVALILALGAEVSYWLGTGLWLQFGLAIIAIGISGLGIYKKGWIAILNKNLNINALMSIAVTGAFILGEWPEAAMVMVLFAIAEAIEARSLDRARNSVEELLNVAPDVVLVKQCNEWIEAPVADVIVGSIVRARPGERIGLDGIITTGQSDINQAPITGESALHTKTVGDVIYAGSINGMAEIEYKVTFAANNTMLAHIIHAVHDAQSRKAPTQRFVDKFSKIYTPIVCLLALFIAVFPPLALGASWYNWIYKALVLLVIACPCALVISTPVAVVSALGIAARNGVLIKGGAYLEQGKHIKNLAFDKTGTLTTGKPHLLDVITLKDDANLLELADIANSMAARSDHPVSKAISVGLKAKGLLPDNNLIVSDLHAVAGGGIKAIVNSTKYFLGNISWVLKNIDQEAVPQNFELQVANLQAQGKTISVLSNKHNLLALFVVADDLRQNSINVINEIHSLGLNTVMLSGDNPATANYIANKAGIQQTFGGLLPIEKLNKITELGKQGVVAMIGDGINDAPALAKSDIGFAMGAIGSDAAIETADIALMDDDLQKIPFFLRLSYKTNSILIQNISFALGIKAVFLIITLLGMATMWMAVFADVGASLIVLANSLRLLHKASL